MRRTWFVAVLVAVVVASVGIVAAVVSDDVADIEAGDPTRLGFDGQPVGYAAAVPDPDALDVDAPEVVVVGATVPLGIVGVADGAEVGVEWFVAGDTIGEGSSIEHTFTEAGDADVSATLTLADTTLSVDAAVEVVDPLTISVDRAPAGLGDNGDVYLTGTDLKMVVYSSGGKGPLQYVWTLPDGSEATDQEVTVPIAEAKGYSFSVTVSPEDEDLAAIEGLSATRTIDVSGAVPFGRPPDPGPTDPGPTDPGPTDPGPTDPGPTDPGPTDPGPTDPDPTCPSGTTGTPPDCGTCPFPQSVGTYPNCGYLSASINGPSSMVAGCTYVIRAIVNHATSYSWSTGASNGNLTYVAPGPGSVTIGLTATNANGATASAAPLNVNVVASQGQSC